MNKLLLAFFMLFIHSLSFSQNERFNMRQLACGLSQPWEIKFGPDGYLWVTEAYSYKLSRVDPATGYSELMMDLSDKKNFPNYHEANEWPQGGLQGFAFHPDFVNQPFLYIAYVYRFEGCQPNTLGCFYKTKIVRYNYNMNGRSLTNELVINDNIPGSTDHNGGRLVIGPIFNNMDYIFYGVGDMGAGHLGNAERAHRGQIRNIYEGKILRFNLIPDGDTSTVDSWIPNDNPFNTQSTQNAVWSLGHRNPQGLVFSPEGILYESEHGPYSDDEINIIRRGHNYGFPLIMGFADGNYDGSKAGAGSSLPEIISEVQNKSSIESFYPYSDPIGSYFAATQEEVSTFYTNDLNNTPPYPNYYLQYPTIAPSGIDHYSSNAIPGWKNSLLVANLKLANVYRLKLSDSGEVIDNDSLKYFQGLGRFRDIAISPDGLKIYVSTDSIGAIKGAPGESIQPPNKGCILEFSYLGSSATESLLSEEIQLIPNPASTQFTLSLPIELLSSKVTITNNFGKVMWVAQTKSDQTNFNLAEMTPGLYYVTITSLDKTYVKKLLIQ